MNYKIIEAEANYSKHYLWVWESDHVYEEAPLKLGTFFDKEVTQDNVNKFLAEAKEWFELRKAA